MKLKILRLYHEIINHYAIRLVKDSDYGKLTAEIRKEFAENRREFELYGPLR